MNFWDNFKTKHIIFAHRGARSIRAENTMSSFEAALGNCDAIELDVGFTKDAVPIVIHDDTLERTSNVKKFKEFKKPYKVIDYTYKQLKKLDFSSWFIEDDPFNTIKDKLVSETELNSIEIQRVLKLKKILRFCKKNKLPVNIEIKDMRGTKFNKIAVEKILEIIKKLKIEHLVLISSFNHNYIKKLHKLSPHISTGILEENNHPKNIVKYLKSIPTQSYHPRLEITTQEIIKEVSQAGFFINIYTINDAKHLVKNKHFKHGVKGIFTDFLHH